MNKKGNQIVIGIIVIIILLLSTGLLSYDKFTKKVYLENVNLENPRISQGTQTKLYFDVVNNLDTTINPKIEVLIDQGKDEECFAKVEEKTLDKVLPGTKLPTYVYVNSNSENYNYKAKNCSQRVFNIQINLKDFNGKVLDQKIIEIGVV